MRLNFALLFHHFLILPLTITFAIPAPAPDTTSTSPSPQSTICGDIVNSCNDSFTARQAYNCLNSVLFDPAVATNFIRYYNNTIQFQSTLAFLKNPPSSYQQPAINIQADLKRIQNNINNALFSNQYAFEVTLQNLVYSAHDAYFQLESGILNAFIFLSPYSMLSLSEDSV